MVGVKSQRSVWNFLGNLKTLSLFNIYFLPQINFFIRGCWNCLRILKYIQCFTLCIFQLFQWIDTLCFFSKTNSKKHIWVFIYEIQGSGHLPYTHGAPARGQAPSRYDENHRMMKPNDFSNLTIHVFGHLDPAI
jgi:hypothetical protein